MLVYARRKRPSRRHAHSTRRSHTLQPTSLRRRLRSLSARRSASHKQRPPGMTLNGPMRPLWPPSARSLSSRRSAHTAAQRLPALLSQRDQGRRELLFKVFRHEAHGCTAALQACQAAVLFPHSRTASLRRHGAAWRMRSAQRRGSGRSRRRSRAWAAWRWMSRHLVRCALTRCRHGERHALCVSDTSTHTAAHDKRPCVCAAASYLLDNLDSWESFAGGEGEPPRLFPGWHLLLLSRIHATTELSVLP